MLKLLDKWIGKHYIAAKKYTQQRFFLLFVDWKSAFDRVDHDRLMQRLKDINVTERT